MHQANPLHRLLNPQSIATVGAGNNPMKMGTMQALSIIKDGFQGNFYPIHPKEEYVLGHKAYHRVDALPETPEVAVFIVPTDQVVSLMEEFGKIGTKYAIVITAGFRETGEEGMKLEEQLKEVANKYEMRFLGPNCIGVLNSQASLNITVMSFDQEPGMLGMASQSGTYITQSFNYLRRRGIRFSKAISVGNEASIDLVDALEYLGEDEDTRAISLYVEGIRDGDRFMKVASKITPHKPVLAQYVGGSEAGARAGSSHTGSMAGPDYLYDGLFKQAGIIRVNSVEDLYGHGWALATQPPLKGKRVAVVTNSGGPGTSMANTLNEGGMEIPEFSSGLRAQLKEIIPPHAASGNPVDITFHIDTQTLIHHIPKTILQSGEIDGMVLHGAMGTGFLREIYPHVKDFLQGLTEEEFVQRYKQEQGESLNLHQKHGLPFLVSSFFDTRDNYTEEYQKSNVPVYDSPEKTAWAMLALNKYREIREGKDFSTPEVPPVSSEASKIVQEALESGQTSLDEYQSKKILRCYGVPVATEELTSSVEEAVKIAENVGYPVVLKGCSPELMHKTETGAVQLNLNNQEEVISAFHRIRNSAGEVPVLVSKMIKSEREFMGGMTRFPGFGPVVMGGLGGIFTEALQDTAFRVAPFNLAEAQEMLFDLKSHRMLKEFRHLPAVDINAMGQIFQAIGTVGLLHPEIKEIDINPILFDGAKPIAVDALMVL